MIDGAVACYLATERRAASTLPASTLKHIKDAALGTLVTAQWRDETALQWRCVNRHKVTQFVVFRIMKLCTVRSDFRIRLQARLVVLCFGVLCLCDIHTAWSLMLTCYEYVHNMTSAWRSVHLLSGAVVVRH